MTEELFPTTVGNVVELLALTLFCLLYLFSICLKPPSDVWSVVLLPLMPCRANKEIPAVLVSREPLLLSVVAGPLMAMLAIVGNSSDSWVIPAFGNLTVCRFQFPDDE